MHTTSVASDDPAVQLSWLPAHLHGAQGDFLLRYSLAVFEIPLGPFLEEKSPCASKCETGDGSR